MPLIATPLSPDANSYLTEAEATEYLTNERLHTTEWSGAEVEVREKALIWASRLLDAHMSWRGYKRTAEQALRFPRSGIQTEDGEWVDPDSIPQILKHATAELANSLLIRERTSEPDVLGLGIKSIEIEGLLSLDVSDRERIDLIPEGIVQLLSPLGWLKAGSGRGLKQLRLYR